MTFKCKICGGQTTVDSQSGIAICEYCGTKQALPLFTEDSERLLYERGNSYLSHSEYDKAENIFSQLLTIRPGAAELYWDLVLCKYGVTYVKDPGTGKYIPTCNRTHYTPIFSDKNYQKAIELSSGEKKELFEEDAKTIDNIQKGIIAVSKKEKPFDIFISYKETDANGNRTKDSIEAQKLYEKLTEAGYKVFFSRITLEDKIGTEYEPYIYAALYSSKVMITVCSSKENIEAVWVKNEWSRYLGFRQNDNAKTMLPLYFDMDKADLPEEFSLLSAYDMSKEGFEDELLRGVKKLIPLPIMKAKRRKQIVKTVGITAACLVVAVGVVAAIIVPKELEQRRVDEKNAADEKAYQAAIVLFDNGDYTAAADAFAELGEYKDSAHMAERCGTQPEYDAAMQLYYDGNYAEATWAFEALGDYEDAAEQKEKAELSWRRSLGTVYANSDYKGAYYINENGTVSNSSGEILGDAHSKIDITKNGRVVSIFGNNVYEGMNSYLFTVHENGVFSNPEMESYLADAPEFTDIIKVSNSLQGMGVVGLRADGKMAVIKYPSFLEKESYLEPLAEWSDIVDFENTFHAGNGHTEGIMVGLRLDGTLCAIRIGTDLNQTNEYNLEEYTKILENFQNVKSFDISGHTIVALTKDHKLLTYIDGEFTESDGSDICDIVSTDLVLKKNGDLVDISNNKVLLRDIVYSGKSVHRGSSYYAVSRNGNISVIAVTYDNGMTTRQTGDVTQVHEEWISRLE